MIELWKGARTLTDMKTVDIDRGNLPSSAAVAGADLDHGISLSPCPHTSFYVSALPFHNNKGLNVAAFIYRIINFCGSK